MNFRYLSQKKKSLKFFDAWLFAREKKYYALHKDSTYAGSGRSDWYAALPPILEG